MDQRDTIHVLGAGAIGVPLAVYLRDAGRPVLLVRTRGSNDSSEPITAVVRNGRGEVRALIDTAALSTLERIDGTIVVATKSHANESLAYALARKVGNARVVIMQNGISVERAFLDTMPADVYRCVLYGTSQTVGTNTFRFRPVTSSPVGMIRGTAAGLAACIDDLTTDVFPFHASAEIELEIWRKAVINTVFNSICPLLETDNGVFARDPDCMAIAEALVSECLTLTGRLGVALETHDITQRILYISRESAGQQISTLQDLRAGRPTEIESLNMEMVRIAAGLQPALRIPWVELLGRLIRLKSAQYRSST